MDINEVFMNIFDIKGNPVTLALVKQISESREEKRTYAEPIEDIKDECNTVVSLALHNTLSDNSYLPQNMVDDLVLATKYVYQVESFKGNLEFNNTVMVVANLHAFNIYVIDNINQELISKMFLVAIKAPPVYYVDSEFTKAQYLETAGRLTNNRVVQYSEDLIFSYKVLFNLIFFTELNRTGSLAEVISQLKVLLAGSEVTLQLNITSTIMLYGDVESDGTLHLYIRQIGTPDTYWKRTASLSELLGQ